MASGDNWTELDLIFPSRVGTPVTRSNLRRAFIKLLAKAGLPKIRFHDLRHTAASLMLNHGIPVLIASRRLGHAKPNITLDLYGRYGVSGTILDDCTQYMTSTRKSSHLR